MPHVDDGTLHALLDGALRSQSPERTAQVEAHLEACEDCRARLRAAESVRGDAAAILASIEPEAEYTNADFEEVRARAKRGSPISPAAAGGGRRRAGVRQARWTRGVAWAASLILALGTGYLIRDLAGPGQDTSSAATSEEARSVGTQTGTADGDRSDAGSPPPPAPETPARRDAPGARPSGSSADAPQAPEMPSGEAAAAPGFTADREGGKTSRLERSAPVDLDPLTATGSSAAGSRSGSGRPGEAVHWTTVTINEAREALEGPVYLLPKARLVEISRAQLEEGATPRVLTLQRLETGVQLRVVQWRGEGLESEVATGGASVSSLRGSIVASDPALPELQVVRVVRGPYVLELTGPLPEGMLSVLGEVASPAP